MGDRKRSNGFEGDLRRARSLLRGALGRLAMGRTSAVAFADYLDAERLHRRARRLIRDVTAKIAALNEGSR